MPRVRTYLDLTYEEIKLIKSLYNLIKINNGNIDHNLKDFGICEEHLKIKNSNVMNHNQLIHYVTIILIGLFNLNINGVEMNTVQKVIKSTI